ncbi:MAG: sigma-70 family RNA polymerase sigma factor [Clostridiales bacterium]|nr:sigma-70 family RNA polymerase sigma factor [Clostridiales bacterium]
MNYELIMLRNALRMKRCAEKFREEMEHIALTSYNTWNWRDGTMGQIEAMAEARDRIEKCMRFYEIVKNALLVLPKGYRALLVAVYLKKIDKKVLAKRFDISLSTVYRKLCRARNSLSNALKGMGCDEEWFLANYGDYEFEERMPRR